MPPGAGGEMDGDCSLVERYRGRAQEIRRLTSAMPPSEARDLLEKIVADYDELGNSARILDQANRLHTDS